MRSLLQFTLDLFDPAPSAQPGAPAPAIRAPADELGAPAGSLSSVMSPAQFRHPRANRETHLSNAVVAYEFKRGKRRTIGFAVGPDGLVVRAPKWTPLSEVDAAVREKSIWILRKLDETRERHERLVSARIDWRDGTTLPFLGEHIMVVLDPRHAFASVGGELKAGAAGAILQAETDAHGRLLAAGTRRMLHVGLPRSAAPEQIRDTVQAWLMRQAKRVFVERLDHFAPRLDVQWRKLSLSNAGTRWGSAGVDGSIRLNWRLIHFNPAIIDYVVAHELSHLRVMDHSPRFWDTVRSVVPDYATLRARLKDELVPHWQ